MHNIIIAFFSIKTCRQVKQMIDANMFTDSIVRICQSKAELLEITSQFSGGVIITGHQLSNEMISDFSQDLPKEYSLLVIVRPQKKQLLDDSILTLTTPLSSALLMQSILMLFEVQDAQMKRRELPEFEEGQKKTGALRTGSQKKLIEQAKGMLMERYSLTELEAHRMLQKKSMDSGLKMWQVAYIVLN